MKIRVFFSCLICRLVTFVIKKLGRGATSTPGKFAIKIKRDVLHDLSKGTNVIVVTGTNGKTTSCRILEEGLIQAKKSYFLNRSGANLISGVTTSFVSNCTLTGKCKKDYAIIECDENAFKEVSRYIRADVILVTNVFRDQLDRYGEVTHTLNAIRESVKNLPDAVLCLNADCSLTYSMSREFPNKIITYGMDVPFDAEAAPPEISDAKYCIFCRHEYDYRYHTYGHLGGFSCPGCGYQRPSADFAVTAIRELEPHHSVVDAVFPSGEKNLIINIGGTYNIYNAMGAAAALTAIGLEEETIISALAHFSGAFGRMEEFDTGHNKIHMILVKNPAGFSQTMSFLSAIERNYTLVISLNDNGQDGRDVSWIWDVDFGRVFETGHVQSLYISGKRCYDMALRVKYEGVNTGQIQVVEEEDYERLVDIAMAEDRDVYIVPTYTSMMAMRPVLAKRLNGKEFWE